MLKHADIWAAIDRLAAELGLTASGLARCAGLDPTTFNRSKRVTREGKTRWPSTESIAKIFDATDTDLRHFCDLLGPPGVGPAEQRRSLPLVSLVDAQSNHSFDSAGRPKGDHWDEIAVPEVTDPQAFAIEVCGSNLEPAYSDGDVLIVSPAIAPRRGDRVLVCSVGGGIVLGRLMRHTARRIELRSLPAEGDDHSLGIDEVAAVFRIVMAKQ